jgi:hypothetical protein
MFGKTRTFAAVVATVLGVTFIATSAHAWGTGGGGGSPISSKYNQPYDPLHPPKPRKMPQPGGRGPKPLPLPNPNQPPLDPNNPFAPHRNAPH